MGELMADSTAKLTSAVRYILTSVSDVSLCFNLSLAFTFRH